MALEKLEGRFTCAAAYSVAIVETGGGGASATVVVVAVGDYYPTSATALLTTIKTALDADPTLNGTYTLTLDDGTDGATGKVTISVAGGGVTSFALTWTTGAAVRDALGFTGTLTPTAATFTATNGCPYVFLPNVLRSNPMAPPGYKGVPVGDGTFTVAPSGVSKGLAYATRYVDSVEWSHLLGRKFFVTYETVVNESWQSFWTTVIRAGKPFRYHRDRTDDATYVTWRGDGASMTAMDARTVVAGFHAATGLFATKFGVIEFTS